MADKLVYVIWGLLGVAIVLVFMVAYDAHDTSKYNLALNRVQLCILSYYPTERTREDIENCYQHVESELGISVIRDDLPR
jgi:hypothetical protein